MKFVFHKEDDIWKFDIMEIMNITNVSLAYLIKETDYSEKEFIELVLENTDNKKVQESHYKPILKE